jgi:hypothetical protein
MPAWETGDYGSVRATLAVSVRRLASAGADFFVCPDNTVHLALDQPGEDLALPGLHIAEVVTGQAARDGRRKVGVLGTKYLMDGPLYPRVLAGQPQRAGRAAPLGWTPRAGADALARRPPAPAWRLARSAGGPAPQS